jgi:hypothetical protein
MSMISWQKQLKDRVRSLENENFRLNQQIAMLSSKANLLEKLVNGPPTIMIACEKIAECAAHQVSDMLQYVKEVRSYGSKGRSC